MSNLLVKDHALEFMDHDRAIAIEDCLWWTVGRQSILRQFLDYAQRLAPLHRIMEVGCGSGGNLRLLAEYGEVVACERSEILASRARARGIARAVYAQDFFELRMPYDSDLTCLFDVLEHIEDDGMFIQRIAARTKDSHRVLISVPACQWLYSRHDELLHHYRRYSRKDLETLLVANGFVIRKSAYFLFSVFPAVVLSRLKEKLLARCGLSQNTVNYGAVWPWLNRILLQIIKAEAWVARLVRFPIGVWVIVLAEKRS